MYLSKVLNLGLKQEIQEAVFRATVQLSLLGFALNVVFEGQNIALSVLFMMVMVSQNFSAALFSFVFLSWLTFKVQE